MKKVIDVGFFDSKKAVRSIVVGMTFSALSLASLYVAFYFGVEEKSIIAKTWDIFAGGGVGALAGVAFFIVFGAFGFVSGAIYGAVGLFSMLFGGVLGGLGLGALVNVVRNPGDFNFNFMVIISILLVGNFVSWIVAKYVAKRFFNYHSKNSTSATIDID